MPGGALLIISKKRESTFLGKSRDISPLLIVPALIIVSSVSISLLRSLRAIISVARRIAASAAGRWAFRYCATAWRVLASEFRGAG
jgi:hypothetical protein